MHTAEWSLKASSPTLDRLAAIVTKHYFLDKCEMRHDGTIANAAGLVPHWRWRFTRNRYRFETRTPD